MCFNFHKEYAFMAKLVRRLTSNEEILSSNLSEGNNCSFFFFFGPLHLGYRISIDDIFIASLKDTKVVEKRAICYRTQSNRNKGKNKISSVGSILVRKFKDYIVADPD